MGDVLQSCACFRRTAVVASSVPGGSCIDSRKNVSGSEWPKARTCMHACMHGAWCMHGTQRGTASVRGGVMHLLGILEPKRGDLSQVFLVEDVEAAHLLVGSR